MTTIYDHKPKELPTFRDLASWMGGSEEDLRRVLTSDCVIEDLTRMVTKTRLWRDMGRPQDGTDRMTFTVTYDGRTRELSVTDLMDLLLARGFTLSDPRRPDALPGERRLIYQLWEIAVDGELLVRGSLLVTFKGVE